MSYDKNYTLKNLNQNIWLCTVSESPQPTTTTTLFQDAKENQKQ